MTIPFIFLTIAFLILLIVTIRQQRRIKDLSEKYHELYDKGWAEYYGVGKEYRTKYRYIVVDKVSDNLTLNNTIRIYQKEGYDIDSHKSTDRLLVFVKHEEVKPGFKNL